MSRLRNSWISDCVTRGSIGIQLRYPFRRPCQHRALQRRGAGPEPLLVLPPPAGPGPSVLCDDQVIRLRGLVQYQLCSGHGTHPRGHVALLLRRLTLTLYVAERVDRRDNTVEAACDAWDGTE